MGPMAIAIISLLLGAGFGCALAYFVARDKLRVQYETRLSAALSDAASSQAALASAKAQAQQGQVELGELRARLEAEQKAHTTAVAQLDSERRRLQEQSALLEKADQKLQAAFGHLAGEALKTNIDAFLKLATEKLGAVKNEATGELEQRKQAVDALVRPIRESLDKVEGHIHELEKQRTAAYSTLTEQVKSLAGTQDKLQAETANLVKALRSPTVRGRWGEIQLRRVVEIAGMLNYCDFSEQESVTTADGRLRPDMIVRLPGGKNIVVDSKAPLKAYLEALEAPDDDARRSRLEAHAAQIRTHIDGLGSKSYWEHLQPTPEFVVMFLPGETFFSEALAHDPSLIEEGVHQKVIVASPTTLIALLKAVSYGWQQQTIATSAQQISDLGRELYERLCTMASHFESVGHGLDNAVKAYNKTVASLESRVLSSARKFPELGTPIRAEIAELIPIENSARDLQAPDWSPQTLELAASAEESPSGGGHRGNSNS